MGVSELTAHLAQRGELLLSGQIDRLLSPYAFPLPMFLENRLLLVQSADHARAMLSQLRLSLVGRGANRMVPRVTAVELPRTGRYRVWIDWHEMGAPLSDVALSSAVYYCRDTAAGTRIEMVNYLRLSMPDLQPRIAALALSA